MALGDKQFRGLVIGAGLLVAAGLMMLRFSGDFALPKKPAKPVAMITSAKDVTKTLERSTGAYQAYLTDDAATFGLSPVPAEKMSAVFPYRVDSEARVLEIGDSVEVLGIKLSLSAEKIKGSKLEHMILSIENLGHKAMAYNIQTRPSVGSKSCSRMAHLSHNALALAAGATIRRAECIYRKGWSLEVSAVETVTLPELGYYYLSSVQAEKMGLDERTIEGHKAPLDSMACRLMRSVPLRNAVASGALSWRDQIDFYARHRCKTYSLPVAYKAFQRDGEQILPVSSGDL